MSSSRIEEWLTRMRQAREPGPVARVMAAKNGRDLGWAFDVGENADLSDLSERIDNCCRDAGYTAYELRAVDTDGRLIAPLAHKVESVQIVQQGASPMFAPSIEDSVQHALKSSRSFAGLGLQSLMEGQKALTRVIDRLQDENDTLREENERLRKRVTEQWDLADKLMSHEVEMRSDVEKASRQGRMVETLTNALMARLLGRGATPEGHTVETRMAFALLQSISVDQANQILPLLSDDQRVALMELLRPQEKAPVNGVVSTAHPNGAPST